MTDPDCFDGLSVWRKREGMKSNIFESYKITKVRERVVREVEIFCVSTPFVLSINDALMKMTQPDHQ